MVFGGDGTMLRVAREIAGSRTPILGINIGGLGFLTAVPSNEMAAALKRVWKGQFQFENAPSAFSYRHVERKQNPPGGFE